MSEGWLIFIVAGEPSGDALGARLMAALKAEARVRFAGVGGERMAAEGLDTLFPMADLSVMGLVEVVPRLPLILRRIRETASAAQALRPDALVTIDSPDFSFRVARRLAGFGFPLIHYVAPTVWAWRPERARRIAGFLDHLLAILPFEPPYFEREGLATTFVGHPVVESGADKGDGAAFRSRHGLGRRPLLVLLPGSRASETNRHLPVFGRTFGLLHRHRPDLVAVVPTVPAVADQVRAAVKGWPAPATVVTDVADKYGAFAASQAALAASGTVALELAMAGTPTVIAYRVGAATAWIARRLVRVHHVSLVNIILDRPAVPEYLQDACRAEALAPAVEALLDNPAIRTAQAAASAEVLARLGLGGAMPSVRAAHAVLSVIDERRTAP